MKSGSCHGSSNNMDTYLIRRKCIFHHKLMIILFLTPDKAIGMKTFNHHGFYAGEIAAGYADDALSLVQTVCVAYERALSASKCSKGDGIMAAVGLSAHEADVFLKKSGSPVVVACDNSPKSVTLTGKYYCQRHEIS